MGQRIVAISEAGAFSSFYALTQAPNRIQKVDPIIWEPTLTYQTLFFCRVPINFISEFIRRTYKKDIQLKDTPKEPP